MSYSLNSKEGIFYVGECPPSDISSIRTTGYDYSINSVYDAKVNKNDLKALELSIDDKINKFLSFLEMKDIIQKGEYEEFLKSIDVFDKISK